MNKNRPRVKLATIHYNVSTRATSLICSQAVEMYEV
jgi:hypothetical protein